MHINQIIGGIPSEYIPTTDIIRGGEMMLVYNRRALVPSNRSNSRDSFVLRSAIELDPDLFSKRPANDLWLSGSTIAKFIAVVKDDLAEMGVQVCTKWVLTVALSKRGSSSV